MKDIAIYGAGGLGREVACMINKINSITPTWNLVGFFDDGKEIGNEVSHFGKTLGGIEELNAWKSSLNVALAFGNPKTIKMVRSRINNCMVVFPNIISPDFEISDPRSFTIGVGNIIKEGCFVSTDVTIGNFNLLNGSNVFGHDDFVGSFNVFMPGTRVSGEVKIGNLTLLGAMSFIRQCLTLPDNVTLGPLSALLTRPRENSTYIGNPAKIIKF